MADNADAGSAIPTAEAPLPFEVPWSTLPRPVFTGGNTVNLLEGGDQLFPAMHEAIANARHEIWLATYIFHDDVAGLALIDALEAADRRGVRVRIVVDGFGSKAALPLLRTRMTGHSGPGIALAVFRPMHRWWTWLQPGQLRRLHQKLCVVDGEVAFVGGINIIDDRNDLRHGLSELPRLDYAVELRGPVVVPVEQAARALWTRAWLGGDFRDELRALARSSQPLLRLRRLIRLLRMPRGAGLRTSTLANEPVEAAFVLRDNLRQRRTIERSYISALRNARERIDLISPYFYPGSVFRRTLRDAAKRGVKVRVLFQGKLDYRIAGLAAQALYDELLANGVRVYEYMPAFLHAKIAIVDDEWATVGSSNIDPLSLLLNLEANVIIRDRGFAAELAERFEAALADSREIDPKTGRSSGIFPVLRRALVAWMAHVYLRIGGATGRY
ncbi:cardiolipin synthase ClsB [Piscinibacter sakaiensis]|uniref:cardiolipin synthase ClsB n=1 Tax=Piscinibacter sakaiensis TaxID=1547922 RepID=UPI003AB0B2DC